MEKKKYHVTIVRTWKDLLMAVVRNEYGPVTNKKLYEALSGHEKGANNTNVQAKIRQTLQRLCHEGLVRHVEEGVWACAA